MPSLSAITCLLLLASTSLATEYQYIISYDNQILSQTTNGMSSTISAYLKSVSKVAADYFKHLLSTTASASMTINSALCSLTPTSFAPVTSPATHLYVVTSYVNEPL